MSPVSNDNDARAQIFRKLRAAPIQSSSSDTISLSIAQHYARYLPDDILNDRLNTFERTMTAVRTEVHRVTLSTLATTLHNVVHAHAIQHIAMSSPAASSRSVLTLAHQTIMTTLQGIDHTSLLCHPVENQPIQCFEHIDAGLTIARCGIANTGSLVLWPGEHEPRELSLVPPIHIALLDAESIHDTLFSAMCCEKWSHAMPTNLLLVSGPSKTSDIQQTLAYGAHGPKALIVLLLLPEEGIVL